MKKRIIAVILTVLISVTACGLVTGCSNNLKNDLLKAFEDSFFGNFKSGKVTGNFSSSYKNIGDSWANYSGLDIKDFIGNVEISEGRMLLDSKFKKIDYYGDENTYDEEILENFTIDTVTYAKQSNGTYRYAFQNYFAGPLKSALTGNISELLHSFNLAEGVTGAETTLGELVKGVNELFGSCGSALDLNKFFGQDASASSVDNGYVLTLMKGSYVTKITNLRNDIVKYLDKPLKDAFKKYFDTDISKVFNGLKKKFKSDSKMNEVIAFLADCFKSTGLSQTIITRHLQPLFEEFGYFRGADFAGYTVNAFITELSGGKYNYDTFVKYVEDLLNDTLGHFIDLLVRDTDFTNETLKPVLTSGSLPYADCDFKISFDKNKNITAIDISVDMNIKWTFNGEQDFKLKANFSVTDLGKTTVNIPALT